MITYTYTIVSQQARSSPSFVLVAIVERRRIHHALPWRYERGTGWKVWWANLKKTSPFPLPWRREEEGKEP